MQYSWPNHLLDLHMHHEEIKKIDLVYYKFSIISINTVFNSWTFKAIAEAIFHYTKTTLTFLMSEIWQYEILIEYLFLLITEKPTLRVNFALDILM